MRKNPSLNVPLTIYRLVVSRDDFGGPTSDHEPIRELVFGSREVMAGRELFEAQKLKYEDPRKYAMLNDIGIKQGMILKDDGEYFEIHSVQRERFYMYLLTSRKVGLEDLS